MYDNRKRWLNGENVSGLRRFISIFLVLGGMYFIIKSTLADTQKMVTMPLYVFYVILGGWFSSLGMIEWLNNKADEIRKREK